MEKQPKAGFARNPKGVSSAHSTTLDTRGQSSLPPSDLGGERFGVGSFLKFALLVTQHVRTVRVSRNV